VYLAAPLVVAVVQVLLQLHTLSRGVEYIVCSVTIDDSYYYLQTAWNWTRLGWITFDGVNPTNGFQLLWFVVVSCLAWLAGDKVQLLYAALVACVVMNALGHVFIWRVCVLVREPFVGLVTSAVWLSIVVSTRALSTAMENSLHAAVAWWLTLQVAWFLVHLVRDGRLRIWGLIAALVANAWTRVDSGVVSVAVYLFCVGAAVVWLRRHDLPLRSGWRHLAGSASIATIGVFVQAAAFWYAGRSVLPVSALTKAQGRPGGLLDRLLGIPEIMAQGFPPSPLARLPASQLLGYVVPLALVAVSLVVVRGVSAARPLTRLLFEAAQIALLGLLTYLFLAGELLFAVYVFLILLAAAGEVAVHGRRNATLEQLAFRSLWYCHLVAFAAYHVVFAMAGHDARDYASWYQSPAFVFWVLTLGFMVWTAGAALARASRRVELDALFRGAVVVLAFVLVSFSIAAAWRPSPPAPIYHARLRAATWISTNLPEDAVLAAWNAGQLGYFSGRTVINLDGLVNSVDYFRARRTGGFSMVEYLREHRVRYLVDYSFDRDVLPYVRVVASFETRADWKPVLILEVVR